MSTHPFIGTQEYFPGIGRIPFEGRGSDNPLEYDSITAWHLDARNAAALLLATRFELHANDVIFVAAQPVSHWSNVVNAITPSLIVSSVNAAAN